jgi:hypothetical protein
VRKRTVFRLSLSNSLFGAVLVATLLHASQIRAEEVMQPFQVATTVAPVSPKIFALAKEWFHRFQTGNIDRSQLDAASNMELTAEAIRQQEAALSSLGKPVAFRYLGVDEVQGDKAYHFLITFNGPDRILESIALDESGKIAGIDFATYAPSTT